MHAWSDHTISYLTGPTKDQPAEQHVRTMWTVSRAHLSDMARSVMEQLGTCQVYFSLNASL